MQKEIQLVLPFLRPDLITRHKLLVRLVLLRLRHRSPLERLVKLLSNRIRAMLEHLLRSLATGVDFVFKVRKHVGDVLKKLVLVVALELQDTFLLLLFRLEDLH